MNSNLPNADQLLDAADTVMRLAQFTARHQQNLQRPEALPNSCVVLAGLMTKTAQHLRDGATAVEAMDSACIEQFQGPPLQVGHPAERLAVQLVQAAGKTFTGDYVLCARVIGPPCIVNEPAMLVEFADGFHTYLRRESEAGDVFRTRVAAELLARPRGRGPYGNVRLLLELPGVAGKTSAQVLEAPEGVQ